MYWDLGQRMNIEHIPFADKRELNDRFLVLLVMCMNVLSIPFVPVFLLC